MSKNGKPVVKESKFIKRWALTREKGKSQYILIHGVLLFGLPMLIFTAFITNPFAYGLFSVLVLVHCGMWLVAGGIYGLIMWHYFERKFVKEKAKHGST